MPEAPSAYGSSPPPFFLILRAAGYTFALPGNAVSGVVEASQDALLELGVGEGGGDLTYLDAHQVFRGGRAGGRFARYAAVVVSGSKRVALGVDTPGRVAPASDARVLVFPDLLRNKANRMLAGFLRSGSDLAVLLDPERLAEKG
jgi:hypothetical protein